MGIGQAEEPPVDAEWKQKAVLTEVPATPKKPPAPKLATVTVTPALHATERPPETELRLEPDNSGFPPAWVRKLLGLRPRYKRVAVEVSSTPKDLGVYRAGQELERTLRAADELLRTEKMKMEGGHFRQPHLGGSNPGYKRGS